MSEFKSSDFRGLYARFQAPITKLDCGKRCAPYNESGQPFCCDTRHAVPTAYQAEWEYLKAHTDMWRRFDSGNPSENAELESEVPPGQVLIACQGADLCQRSFRSLVCRSFPFFPYFNEDLEFIGLSYYWEYEDRCWVISNLNAVTPEYLREFVDAYDALFERYPDEEETFCAHSYQMRLVFASRKRTIPLLHRDGGCCKISPKTGKLKRVSADELPKFGPYQVAALLPFPEELAEENL
jgi:hypothetical protein